MKKRFFYLGAGLFLAGLAFCPPWAGLSRIYFTAHMAQHILLLLAAPPLLLMALPRREGQGDAGKTGAFLSWFCGVGGMWAWHVPALCALAMSHPLAEALQDLSLPLLGLAFWRPITGPGKRLPPLPGVLYLFTACVGCTLLGIFITFAPPGLFPCFKGAAAGAGSLTPAQDQQIGGLLMWVPACLIYLTGVMGLLGRWFAAPESGIGRGKNAA